MQTENEVLASYLKKEFESKTESSMQAPRPPAQLRCMQARASCSLLCLQSEDDPSKGGRGKKEKRQREDKKKPVELTLVHAAFPQTPRAPLPWPQRL